MRPIFVGTSIVLLAVTFSAPATAYHFVFQYKKPPIPDVRTYSAETVQVMDYIAREAKPGDVVLPGADLMGPVCALTQCRVPLGYFSTAQVSSRDFNARSQEQGKFWEEWRSGRVQEEFLRATGVRYVTVQQGNSRVFQTFYRHILTQVFATSDFAVFKVDRPARISTEIVLCSL